MARAKATRKRSKTVAKDEDSTALVEITLTATVPAPSEQEMMSTPEALALFRSVDARALRRWHQQGLPFTKLPDGKVVYPIADALLWHRTREYLKGQGMWIGNTTLDMARCYRIEARRQATDPVHQEPSVMVPLAHDHPLREALLRMAAQGQPVQAPPDPASWEPSAGICTDD